MNIRYSLGSLVRVVMKRKKRKSQISNVEDHNGIRISYHEKVCAERMKTIFKLLEIGRASCRERV